MVEADVPENSKDASKENAFQELFEQHYSLVVRKVMVLVKEQSVAEDIAQEVFMKLYRTDRNSIDNLAGWLTKVAVNTAYNHIRTEKRHRARTAKQRIYESDSAESVEDGYEKSADISEVQQTLMKLPQRDRDILIMKFSGYSYEEIAKNKGLEKVSIGTLLARAKQRFKNSYMEERGEEK